MEMVQIPVEVADIVPKPHIILSEPFPPESACKFCGSCAGCEHLVAVIDIEGRPVPVYGPGLQETRRLVTLALARLLMD